MRLHSRPERYVFRALSAMSDVGVEPHPTLAGGNGNEAADFLVTAAPALEVYVEVAMTAAQADIDDTRVLKKYEGDFVRKLALYGRLGIEPVVIWADEAASPRALARRLNAVRARLKLPLLPPAPHAWYEVV